jgi:hypothetical protein
MTVVSFGGLTFDDSAQAGWTLARLQGWYDAAPSRRSVRDRPQADGAFGVDRYFRGARVVTVEGSYIGSSLEDAYRARDRLAALQADGRSSEFTVSDLLGERSAGVELLRAPEADDGLYQPFFQFAFDVVAADPRRYGPVEVVSTGLPSSGTGITYPIVYPIDYGTPGDPGRLIVSNTGTQETTSVFEVSGGLDAGFEIKDIATGRRLRFERLVPLGSTVVLNARTGRAYLDVPANDVSGFLTVREWWSTPPSVSQEIQFSTLGSTSGTPTLTARTRPAY